MSQLEIAINTPLLRYSGYSQEARPEKFQSASALFYLINHGRKNGFEPRVKTRVLQHIRNIITGGREPCMDCQHFWHYPLLSATLTLAKNTPEIWNEFSASEISAIDTLMECFVYITNFIANDKNDGYYVLVNFEADSAFPAELERIFGITEGIMRSIVVRKDA